MITPAPMRVLHFIDTGGPGGAETVFLSLADAAQRRGENAAVAVPYDGWLAARLRERGMAPTFLPAKGRLSLTLVGLLVGLARSSRASLIHAHLLGASVYAALAGALLRLPVIAVFHGATDLHSPGSMTRMKRWLLTREHVRIVAVSDAVRDALAEWGIPKDTIELIPNGVDTELYIPGRSTYVQDLLGLPAATKIVGAVGNLRPAKDYGTLVTAAAELIRLRPDVHVAVAGSGKDADVAALGAQISEAGLVGRVHLLGFQRASAGLYQSLSVLVSSARSEGLPLSFLEAMACGIPIVATANEGSTPLLGQTGAGILSPAGDAGRLARSMAALLDDPAEARRLGDAGRRAACELYSLGNSLRAYQDLYVTLCASH